VFSFDNVCDMLDINAEYMRAGLRRWKEKKLIAIQLRNEERVQQQAFEQAQALLPESERQPVVILPAPVLEVKHVAKPAPMHGRRKSEPARVASRSRSKLRKARA